jgi:hypothetical protein
MIQAAVLVFMVIAVQVVFGLIVTPATRAFPDPLLKTILTVIGYSVSFGAVILVSLRKSGLSWKERMATGPGSVLFALAVVFTVFGLQILISELDNLFRKLLPQIGGGPAILEQIVSGEGLFALFILLVLIAPVAEETLFRGVILRGFFANYGTVKALLVSALIFAVSHLNIWQFAGAFILGMYLAYVYGETRSLSLCVGAHLLNNAVPFIFLHLMRLEIPGFSALPTAETVFQPLWLDLTGAGCVLVGLGLTTIHLLANGSAFAGQGRRV